MKMTALTHSIQSTQAKFILLVVLITLASFFAPAIGDYFNNFRFVEARYIHIEGVDSDDQINAINRKLTAINPEIASLEQIKSGLEELGWIHNVRVRKVWPDKLHIFVEKQVPLARWNETDFLNSDGEVFSSQYIDAVSIPALKGPQGSERLVMWQFQKLNSVVGVTGQGIGSLELNDRGSWSFILGSVSVRLGKEDILERMRRLLRVYKEVGFSEKLLDIEEIDTRYPNGIAVRWKNGKCLSGCYANNHNLKRDITL